MKTAEIITLFAKGGQEAFLSLSDKQAQWLRSQAEKEGILERGSSGELIYLPDARVFVLKPGYRASRGYGGLVGKKPTGRFGLSLHFYIRFKSTGITAMHRFDFLQTAGGLKSESSRAGVLDGHEYEIFNYKTQQQA